MIDPVMIDKMVTVKMRRDNVSDLDIFNKDDQQFLLGAGKPVLLVGPHGVGKTSVLRSLATNFNLNMHELNASTLDPFVHIVGIPVTHEGKVTMTPPDALQAAEILFIDEINRADRPTRNALFELVCDHSVNGKKLKNLKLVVAAMNPPDGNYQVDALDEAMDDRFLFRFHINRDISYALSLITDENRRNAVERWYKALDDPPSPRRLTWVVETAMGEDINEAALLNALDDTLYGSKALLRMMTAEHGHETMEPDLLLGENEKVLIAKVLASAFINHEEQITEQMLVQLEKYADAEWMPDPGTQLGLPELKDAYGKSEVVKDVEQIFPFNIILGTSITPHEEGWLNSYISTRRAEL